MSVSDRMKPKSFGIRGMIERASALGGTLVVNAGKQAGTIVAITIPLTENAAH
jgi:signal transduction histidine kinase